MLGFNAFKGIDSSITNGLKTKEAFSLGAHNSLLQLASMPNMSTSVWGGMGAGAAYGAADGAFSYDGSILGGAFHGAILGAGAGAGAKFAANTYAKGSAFAKESNGAFSNSWSQGATNAEGKAISAFQTSAFKAGWG